MSQYRILSIGRDDAFYSVRDQWIGVVGYWDPKRRWFTAPGREPVLFYSVDLELVEYQIVLENRRVVPFQDFGLFLEYLSHAIDFDEGPQGRFTAKVVGYRMGGL